ncbi:MAG: 2-keto-4-pentenoate hydratase [Hyphomicrobiaceae bacterium]
MNRTFDDLAARLANAWVAGTTIALPPRDQAPETRSDAYHLQDRMAEIIAKPVVGWKVGASVPAVQLFEGHDGPLPGRIFSDRCFEKQASVPAQLFHTAKVETEFAFKLISPLTRSGPVTREHLLDKLTFHPAIELSASRYSPGTGNRALTSYDGIADNGTSGAVVLGEAVSDWKDLQFENLGVDSRIDDSPPIQAYSGAFRRDPVEIVAETINDLTARGITFEPGMCLLTGSLTLPTPIRQGQTLVARVANFSPVVLTLE